MSTDAPVAAGSGSTPAEQTHAQADSSFLENVDPVVLFLRRPFPVGAVKWKIQTHFPAGKDNRDKQRTAGIVVAYIDRSDVIDRLNLALGFDWTMKQELTPQNPHLMFCDLTLHPNAHNGVTRRDVGESSKGFSKDLFSDSLKRAADLFGVGTYLRAVPTLRLKAFTDGGDCPPDMLLAYGPNKQNILITEENRRWLDAGYANWLDRVGIARFGPPVELQVPDAGEFWTGAERADAEEGTVSTEERAAPAAARAAAVAGQDGQETGEVTEEAAQLRIALEQALGMLGEPEQMITARLRGARGNVTTLRMLLENAAQKWAKEHPDEACPWQAKAASNGNGNGKTSAALQQELA